MTEPMTEPKREQHLLPWNFWCRLFHHKLESTGLWLRDVPNVGLYRCSRCGGLTQTFPPYSYISEKMQLYTVQRFERTPFVGTNRMRLSVKLVPPALEIIDPTVTKSNMVVMMSDITCSKADIDPEEN